MSPTIKAAKQINTAPNVRYEFQRLHGMGESLHNQVLKESGVPCRIYAPVGKHSDLLAYLVRRLLENGANSSFVNQIVDTSITPEEIAKDPQSVFKYITISPVKKDGDIVGYRVSPGRDAALFNDVGLQPGDIAVQLNGIDLSDPSSSVQLMQVMSDPQELNLTVERDGQQYDIYIQL